MSGYAVIQELAAGGMQDGSPPGNFPEPDFWITMHHRFNHLFAFRVKVRGLTSKGLRAPKSFIAQPDNEPDQNATPEWRNG